MYTISVLNLKGGVGKTTTVGNIGHIMATEHNKKVLIIDNDKQGNLSRGYQPKNGHSEDVPTLADVLSGAVSIKEAIQDTKYKHMKIVTANMDLINAEGAMRENKNVSVLGNQLKDIENEFDFCMIDNAPDINMTVINGLFASDSLIIPIRCDEDSMSGMTEVLRTIEAISEMKTFDNVSCLVTQYQNNLLSKGMYTDLQNKKEHVFDTKIRNTIKVAESAGKGCAINDYAPKSTAAQDYKALCAEILELCQKLAQF